MAIKTDARQIVSRDFLDQLTVSSAHDAAVVGKRADETQVDDLLTAINSDLTVPIRMVATDPVDLVITLDAATLTNPGTGRSSTMYPIDDVVSTFTGGTITFSAANITPSVGAAIPMATSNSAFNKLGVYIDSSGNIVLVEGTEGASIALAVAPPEQPGMTYVGYIAYSVDGGGNVANLTNADIFQFVAPSTGLAGIVNQDRGMKLLGGGIWSVTAGPTLNWDAHAYLQVPGMANDRNRINVSASSVTLAANQVAYVDINRIDPGVATDLPISVVGIASFVNMNDRVIIARENDGAIIVGDDSFRINVGESQTLEASASNETLALLGSGVTEATSLPTYSTRGAPERTIDDTQAMLEGMSSMDAEIDKFFGQLRIEPHPTDAFRATVTGVDFTMKDGTTLSQEIASLVMEFTGAIVNFDTGEILKDDDVTPLGINFTPTVIPLNDYHWYSLSLVASTQDVTTEAMEVQFVVLPASGTDAVAANAPYAPFGGSKKLGQVQVQNLAGIANVGTIRQLGVGAGGGGNDQDRNLKLLEGGTWSVTGGGTLAQSTFATGNNVAEGALTASNEISQSFTATGTGIVSVSTRAFHDRFGANTADIRGYIYLADGSDLPTGPALATSTAVSMTTLTARSDGAPYDDNASVTFNFAGEAITPSTKYCFVLKTEGGYAGANLFMSYRSDDPFAGHLAGKSNDNGGTWNSNIGGNPNSDIQLDIVEASAPALTWSADAYIQVPGQSNDRNTISANPGGDSIANGEVAYVEINRLAGATDILTVAIDDIENVSPFDPNILIFARGVSDGIIVGNNSFKLISGESMTLESSTSVETLAYTGATDTADNDPNYSSTNYVSQSANLTTSVGALDAALAAAVTAAGNIANQDRNLKLIGGGTWSAVNTPGGSGVFANGVVNNAPAANLTSVNRAGAQGFTATNCCIVSFSTTSLSKIGATSLTMRGYVYTDVAGAPGVLVATSTNTITDADLDVNTGNVDHTAVTFNFSGEALTPTADYWAIWNIETFVSGNVRFNGNSSGPTGLLQWSASYPTGFTPISGWDANLTTVESTAPSTLLSWSADAYIQVPGLANTENAISAGNVSFATNQVATVEVNRTASGPALSVVATDIDLLTVTDNTAIFARQDGADVIVGTHSFRLKDGESLELDGALAELNRFHDQFRIRTTANTNEISVESANTTMLDGTFLRQELNGFVVDFTGATIDFTAGTSTINATGLSAIGTAIPAVGEYQWFGIGLLPDTVGVDGKMTPQFVVTAAASSNATQASAPFPVVSGDKKIGAVLLQNLAGVAVVTEISRFSVGASGGASGDANSIIETLKNQLNNSFYDAVTANVFSVDEEAKVDTGTSTGEYSLVSNNFELDAAETMVSLQMLDTEFLAAPALLSEIDLTMFWDLATIDTSATYEVSRDGVEYQTVTMERNAATEVYTGNHAFVEEATTQQLAVDAVTDGTLELDATNEFVSQAFTLATASVIKDCDFTMTINGSPVGELYIALYTDNAGDPDTLITESVAIDISTLVGGLTVIDLPNSALAAGTYHLVVRTSASYKAAYVASTTSVELSTNTAAATLLQSSPDAVVWSPEGKGLTFDLQGSVLDLRIRVTASTTAQLAGYGIFYEPTVSGVVQGIKNRQVFSFNATDNLNEFALTVFTPDADLLSVYLVETGQVFRNGAFSLDGRTVKFPVNTFDNGGTPTPYTLVCDQTIGNSFDNSDLNGLLLSGNFLGSTDSLVDKSVAGRGIFLRRPDGTLREITIDDSDSIVVYSV